MIYPHFDTSFWLKTLNSTYLLSAVFFVCLKFYMNKSL